jgi:hypothetical protein
MKPISAESKVIATRTCAPSTTAAALRIPAKQPSSARSKGNVVCEIIEDTSIETLNSFIDQAISEKVDLVATDMSAGYREGMPYYIRRHEAVDHRAKEYVRGQVHTNKIENFWSLLKRGIIGTYHNVSAKYLPLYLNEFQFRFNNRKNKDIFGSAIAGC